MDPAEIVIEKVTESVWGVGVDESVTVIVIPLVVPAVVGVPEITPAELRDRPAGRELEVDQVNGGVPELFEASVTL